MKNKLDGDYKTSLLGLLKLITKEEPMENLLFEASRNLTGFAETLLKMQMERCYGKDI